MDKIKSYISLIRPKHYIKNLLVFLPLLFSGQICDKNKLIACIIAFISFCFLASSIYIINDIKDEEADKNHPVKKERPIASGKIKKKEAIILLIILIFLTIVMNVINLSFNYIDINLFVLSILLELLYLFINIAYSFGLKNILILDVVILVSGYVIRMVYGAEITDITISNWLYLTIIMGAFFVGFGKRRNEKIHIKENSRDVVKKYNENFLDKFMYVCLILTVVFYSLWCIDKGVIERIGNNYMIWTIPLLLIIFMKYCLNLEDNSLGDPVDIFFSDKVLMGLSSVFVIFMLLILYKM